MCGGEKKPFSFNDFTKYSDIFMENKDISHWEYYTKKNNKWVGYHGAGVIIYENGKPASEGLSTEHVYKTGYLDSLKRGYTPIIGQKAIDRFDKIKKTFDKRHMQPEIPEKNTEKNNTLTRNDFDTAENTFIFGYANTRPKKWVLFRGSGQRGWTISYGGKDSEKLKTHHENPNPAYYYYKMYKIENYTFYTGSDAKRMYDKIVKGKTTSSKTTPTAKKKTTTVGTAKKQPVRKPIKGKPGYSLVTKTKKGYCVPETKQHYWKRL